MLVIYIFKIKLNTIIIIISFLTFLDSSKRIKKIIFVIHLGLSTPITT